MEPQREESALRLLLGNSIRVVGVVVVGFLLIFGAAQLGWDPIVPSRLPPTDPRAAEPGRQPQAELQVEAEPDPAFEPLARGLDLLDQKHYDEAEAALLSVRGEAQGLATAYAASAAVEAARFEDALRLYGEARIRGAREPFTLTWLAAMAWVGESLGFHSDALQDLRALSRRPECTGGDLVLLAQAEEVAGQTAEARRRLDGVLSRSDLDARLRVAALLALARLDLLSPRAADAEARVAEALEHARAGLPPGDPTRAYTRRLLVAVLLDVGASARAEAALAALEGSEHDDAQMRGFVAMARGRLAEAEALLRKANTPKANPASEASTWQVLAEVHQLQGRTDEARADLAKARALLARCPQPGPADRGWLALNSGLLEHDASETKRGVQLLKEAGYTGGPLLAAAFTMHGETLRRSPEARPAFQEALRLLDESVGRRHPEAGLALRGLARLEADPTERHRLLQEALAAFEASLGPEHPDLRQTREELKR